jgi:hypothetical protein
MSQRNSGRVRVPHDAYQTREQWVTTALCEHFPVHELRVLEPACGAGFMASAFLANGASEVRANDVVKTKYSGFYRKADFLDPDNQGGYYDAVDLFDVIATNPPYGSGGATALAFAERGIELLRQFKNIIFFALLLKVDFDSGRTRAHVFRDCPEFAAKIVLLERISWFKPKKDVRAHPSDNHAWFVWQRPAAPQHFAFGMQRTHRLLYQRPRVTTNG